MSRQLEGKTCIVTGGAGSIGRATARLFAAQGANVMLVDRAEAELQRVAADLNNGNIAYVAADVTDAASVGKAVTHDRPLGRYRRLVQQCRIFVVSDRGISETC